jgi:phage terminase large subunit-like protein
MLTITEGTKVGQPFSLLPWHVFCTGSLFGWRRTSGRMRFRSAWVETGKGQAKSPWMAAIGLYMAGFYGIERAKAFAIGQDRNTANVLFKDAVAMCRGPIPPAPGDEVDEADTLVERGIALIRGEGDNAWKIEFPESDALFQSLANGEAISGPKPTLVAADEIHEFKTNTSIELWKNAIAKMPGDALMLLGTNTPSSDQIVGTDYSDYYQKVARGLIVDDEAFGFIARVDKADRETVFDTPEVWTKSLPALGITFPRENVDGMVNTAKQLLSTALSTKRLYFGIPIGATEFWIAEEAWTEVQGEFDVADMVGLPCWLSLDLSKKNDLTALTACWRDDKDHLWVKTWYWTTSEGLAQRSLADQAPYDQWVEKEFITPVDGAVIDKTFIAAEVAEICAVHEVEFLAFDPAGIADFIAACEDIGFDVWRWTGPDCDEGNGLKLVSHAQGNKVRFEDKQLTMPRSIERLEDRILEKTITIESSPVTYSCAANAHVLVDGQENRAFDKKRSRGRIDGIVTIAMATGAATMNETDDGLDGFLAGLAAH